MFLSDGPTTAYQQQKIMHTQMKRKKSDSEEPNPRELFCSDLIKFIKTFTENNDELVPVILGDWNKEFSCESSSMHIC